MMKQLPGKLRLVTAAEVDSSDDLLGELKSEAHYTGAVRLITISAALILISLIWAWFGVLDEVSTGTGKVIPSSRDLNPAWAKVRRASGRHWRRHLA